MRNHSRLSLREIASDLSTGAAGATGGRSGPPVSSRNASTGESKPSPVAPNRRTHFRGAKGDTRRGWMLVELIVVLSMTALLGGSAIMLIAKLLGAQTRMASSVVEHRTLSQLEQRLREDGRRSDRIELEREAGTPTWTLRFVTSEAGPVYTFSETRVERQIAGQLAGRWGDFTGRWEATLGTDGRWVRLDLLGQDAISGETPQSQAATRIILRRIEVVTKEGP